MESFESQPTFPGNLKLEASIKAAVHCLLLGPHWLLASLILRPCRQRRHLPTWRCISEYRTLSNHRCENLKSFIRLYTFKISLHLMPSSACIKAAFKRRISVDFDLSLKCNRNQCLQFPVNYTPISLYYFSISLTKKDLTISKR
jgi:hypothetical protein